MSKIKYLCIILFLFQQVKVHAQNPNSWIRVADFGGIARSSALSFSTDSFAYVGLGEYYLDTFPYTGIHPTDLWQYNPYTNVWTQKASFPGAPRIAETCFTIGNKAYIGLGQNNHIGGANDFWEYDQGTDTWTQLSDFPGGSRSAATGFSVGTKGYVGLGSDSINFNLKDMWEYDPATDTWTQKADFGGEGRSGAISFNIQNIGYVGLGIGPNNFDSYLTDLWQYDTAVDNWIQKSNFPGGEIDVGFTFAIGSKGYFGTGVDSTNTCRNDFWEYNSQTDQWIEKDTFGGGTRGWTAGFSIGNKGYAGTGASPNLGTSTKDFWMYTPDSIVTGIKFIDISTLTLSPNPTTDKLYINTSLTDYTLTISDMTGRSWPAWVSGQSIDVSALPAGVYCVRVLGSNNSIVKKFVKE